MSWNSAPSFSRLSRNRSSANLRALSPSALSRGRTRWCRPRTRVDGPRGFPHACTGSGWRSQARVELSVVCQFGFPSMLSITRVLCLSTMRCSGRCRTASANAARPSFKGGECLLQPRSGTVPLLDRKGSSSSKCPYRGRRTERNVMSMPRARQQETVEQSCAARYDHHQRPEKHEGPHAFNTD
jgi:hypothetical protein